MNEVAMILLVAYAGFITYANFSKEITIKDLEEQVESLTQTLSLNKSVITPKALFKMSNQGDKVALCYLSNGTIENCDINHSSCEIYRAGTDEEITTQVRLILTSEFHYNGY